MRRIQCRCNTGVTSPGQFHTKYTVMIAAQTEVPAYFQTFNRITGYGRNTLFGMPKRYIHKHGMIDDERVGFRQSANYGAMRSTIKEFLSQLNYVENHYCRGKSGRKHLPSDLNIPKLYLRWHKR